jgi:hypothetical protein
VDDDVVTALEESIADLGTLLVQMDKFRAGETADAQALRAACLGIGDRARRAHRHGALDAALARELGADAASARDALERWLAEVRASPVYRRAVEAFAGGDVESLRSSLCDLYAGAVGSDPPLALFHPVVWQRRGRPRPVGELADELSRLRDEGLPADSDVATPGVDPALPGVMLHPAPPPGAPVYLSLRGEARPSWVLVLATSGDLIVPSARFRTPFAVGLADPDDDELDAWTLDPATYRREVAAALTARGIPIDDTPVKE